MNIATEPEIMLYVAMPFGETVIQHLLATFPEIPSD
jgi:hypothetical protein